MKLILVILSFAAFICASPIEHLQQTKSPQPDISSLPLESAHKPADVTKTSFDADKTKPKRENTQSSVESHPLNSAQPHTPTDNQKTTSTLQPTRTQNLPQKASSSQQFSSQTNQQTQPQSTLNNNHEKTSTTYSNIQKIPPRHHHAEDNNPSVLSSSSRVRRETVKTEEVKKTGTSAVTSQNATKQQNSQQYPTSAPVRKTREAPKEVKYSQPASSVPSTNTKPQQNVQHVKTPASQTPVTDSKTPVSSPIRKTREVPKDQKIPAPTSTAVKQPQTQFTHDVKQTATPDRKTREAPKKTNDTPATAQKPVTAPKTPLAPTAAPARKTREAPNPTEQSKIVPSAHNIPLKTAENHGVVTELKPQTSLNGPSQTPSSLASYHHPVPVNQILKKPEINSQSPFATKPVDASPIKTSL